MNVSGKQNNQRTYPGIKRAASVVLTALLTMALVGCSGFKNTEIVLTTGLSGNQLFKVGSSICTLPEAMVYVDAYEEQYESVYGVEMWEHDFGGVTLEEYVKGNIVSQLATIKAMTLLAEEYQVSLSEQDLEKTAQAAREYYSALDETRREWMGVSEKDIQGIYEDHLLANRVYEEITKNVNTEVSDDEARIITVQQIFLTATRTGEDGEEAYSQEERQAVYEKAKDILTQLEEGREFLTLASIYNQEEQITCSFGRGEKDAAYEEAAFALEKDQISGIIETQKGYYILKCTENFDREATERNKETMLDKRRDTVFQEVYENLIANTPSEFNNKLWEKVHFENPSQEYLDTTFFEIYDAYFR